MNKFLKFTLIFFPFCSFAQNSTIEQEVVNKACDCINQINENKLFSRKHFYDEISKCIDDQVLVFQTADKLSAIKLPEDNTKKNSTETIDISIDTNKNSSEYLKYYRIIEDNLFTSCENFKNRISATEIGMENEIPSKNSKAIDFFYKGNDEIKNENWKKAVEYYQKAVKEDPNFTFAWDNLGLSSRRLNRFNEAITAYEKSLSINPYGIMPLQNIPIVYIYAEKFDKAKEAYEKFIKVYPDHIEPVYGLANLYISHFKDYEKGLDYACKAFKAYVKDNSPFRSDAEYLIQIAYNELKKQGKEKIFNEILEANNISNQ